MMINTLNIFSPHTKEILMKIAELASAVAEVSAQLTKVRSEILGKLTALEEALANADLPEEAVAALLALRDEAQSLDDIVPDRVPDPE